MEGNKLRILELYSGIGGMHYSADRKPCVNSKFSAHVVHTFICLYIFIYIVAEVGAEVVFSVDINTAANEVYQHNFPHTNQQSRNIESLTAKEINKLKPNIIMMSPPCQPFTRVGLKLDVEDSRCSSFLHLLEVLPNLETVSLILMENVVGFEKSEMRNAFIKTLKNCAFYIREFILSPESLNIPNSRNRYYLLARKSGDFLFGSEEVIVCKLFFFTHFYIQPKASILLLLILGYNFPKQWQHSTHITKRENFGALFAGEFNR